MQSDYIKHHGIRGQKWGVRRFQNKDGSLKPAGEKRYYDDNKKSKDEPKNASTSGEQKKGLSDSQKKALKVGAAVLGTTLAAYGGYKLYQINKNATSGLSNQYHDKAVKAFTESNKLLSNGFASNNKILYNKAADLRDAGKAFQSKAQSSNYSVKEKVDYLKNKSSNKFTPEQLKSMGISTFEPERIKVDRTPISTTNIKGSQTFSKAAQANDDLVNQLLKKNAGALAKYSMSDLMKLDLY